MDANEHIFAASQVSEDEGDVLYGKRAVLGAGGAAEDVRLEFTVAGWDLGFGKALGGRGVRPDHPGGDVHLGL